MTASRIPIIEYERRRPERIDENVETWLARPHAQLARIAAALHKQRNMSHRDALNNQILAVRRAIADVFLRGVGIEGGAGPRPWPVPITLKSGTATSATGMRSSSISDGMPRPRGR